MDDKLTHRITMKALLQTMERHLLIIKTHMEKQEAPARLHVPNLSNQVDKVIMVVFKTDTAFLGNIMSC